MLTLSLKYIALLLASVGLFVAAFVVARTPSSDGATRGTRGAKRRAALGRGGLWTSIEPAVRWLGTRGSVFLPDKLRNRIDVWLMRAGDPLGIEPEELIGLVLLCGMLGVAAGTAHGFANQRNPVPYAIAAGLLGFALPLLRIDAIRDRRMISVQRGLPPTVDILCLGLSAGLDFPASVRQFIEKSSSPDDPLVGELAILLSELQLGKSRREALLLFAERNPINAVREFVSSVTQAEASGTPLASVFQIQAESSRRRRSVVAEETAAKTGVRLMLPMMMVFGSVLLILMGPLALSLSKVMQ